MASDLRKLLKEGCLFPFLHSYISSNKYHKVFTKFIYVNFFLFAHITTRKIRSRKTFNKKT